MTYRVDTPSSRCILSILILRILEIPSATAASSPRSSNPFVVKIAASRASPIPRPNAVPDPGLKRTTRSQRRRLEDDEEGRGERGRNAPNSAARFVLLLAVVDAELVDWEILIVEVEGLETGVEVFVRVVLEKRSQRGELGGV
jgi:hypothetical protein